MQSADEEVVKEAEKTLIEHNLRREVKFYNECPPNNRGISEKEFEKLLETMIKMEFETEE